jgi:AcrR family transcriptional regulator
MKAKPRKPPTAEPEGTARHLLDAAEIEFNTRGFHGTDTNRIARAAGYAPQTFYRHYDDKIAIFLAVYDRWWRSEGRAIAKIIAARGSFEDIADTVICFHTRWRIFRRSLRHLAVEDSRVRAARAAARLEQLHSLKAKRAPAQLAAALLALERLCDAVAEGEFADLGISRAEARKMVAQAVRAAGNLGTAPERKRSR